MTESKTENCRHPGCSENGTGCFLPDNQTGEPDEYYCLNHCQEHGYCYMCGQFWGGVESFEFGSILGGIEGLCENCSDALKSEFGEDDYDYDFMNDGYY